MKRLLTSNGITNQTLHLVELLGKPITDGNIEVITEGQSELFAHAPTTLA
jgi:hypothetical protein